MHYISQSAIRVFGLILIPFLFSVGVRAQQQKEVSATVKDVTVFLQRAQVFSSVKTNITAGETEVAIGKLEVLQRKKQAAPIGWIQTKDGFDSTNPEELKLGGAMLPLGGASASYKGYGLGSVVDIFSAVLSGANYGPWVPPFVSFLPLAENPVGEGIGHFLGAMRIDGFRPADEFKAHMDNWIRTFRNSKAKPGEKVFIPGDPERATSEIRMREGIHLLDPVIQDLEELARKFGLEF